MSPTDGASISIAGNDHSFTSIPHEAALDLIAGLGFDSLKLGLFEGESHVQPHEVRSDVATWAGRIDERVRGRGLEVVDVVCVPAVDFRTWAINHPSEYERQDCRMFVADMIDFVARLGAPGMTMQPGLDWETESHEQSLARTAHELAPYVAAAEARGIRFSIEPHVGSVCQTAADAQWLCETVPGLTLALDYSQFVVQGLAEAEADSLIPNARLMHARGAAPGRLQAPLRDSTIDYRRIVRQMGAHGFKGAIAVEWYLDPTQDGVDVLSETAALRDLLRTAISDLEHG